MADERGTIENLETGRYLIADNFDNIEENGKKDLIYLILKILVLNVTKKRKDFKLELRP